MYKQIIDKIQKNEECTTYSEDEVMEIIKNMLIKKSENYKNEDMEILKKNWKKAFANGLTILGMIHGANYINKMPQPKSEREKSPTYQRIMEQRSQKAKNREPSSNLSDEEQVEQARKQGREQAQKDVKEMFSRNYENSRDKKIDDFLHNVSGVESSFGKNTKHKTMKSGIHANTSAYGNYGLMPKTINELANRMDKDSPLKSYNKMNPDQIKESLDKNPDHQHQFAKFMANHLYDKHGGDENKMAYSWNMGHNIDSESIGTGRHANYMNHDYVQKYNKFKNQNSKQNIQPKEQKVASNNLM